jgi:hypothetical protein
MERVRMDGKMEHEMTTLVHLIGLVGSLLVYTAAIALGSWLAAHCIRAAINYVPKVKREASLPFRISYWLMLTGLALATIAWAFLVLGHFAEPNSWWGEQPHWIIPFITVSYLLPVALVWAVWGWHGIRVRLVLLTIALLYLGWCWITSFMGPGFMFLPTAGILIVASTLRAFALLRAPNARRGGD